MILTFLHSALNVQPSHLTSTVMHVQQQLYLSWKLLILNFIEVDFGILSKVASQY